MWWERRFAADVIRAKLGRQDANSEFAFLDSGRWFVHSSMGLAPTVPMPTFPNPGIGATISIEPIEMFSFGLGIFEGSPNGGRLGLSRLLHGGAFLIAQSTIHVGRESSTVAKNMWTDWDWTSALLPGSYHVGLWYSSPDAVPIAAFRTLQDFIRDFRSLCQ